MKGFTREHTEFSLAAVDRATRAVPLPGVH